MNDKKTEKNTDNKVVEEKELVSKQEDATNETKEPSSNQKADNLIKRAQFIALIIAVGFLVWYFVISPSIAFKQSEKLLEEAGKKYFDFNYTQLPTGERVATVTLQELFHKSFMKEDIYIPNTKEPCSLTESWVKVRREKGEYKYYTYLKCGIRKSSVDHEGPEITLKGENVITIGKGDEYKEPGVKSVKDNIDGNLDIKDVVIKSSAVNTNEAGEYEVTYTAVDSLKNKTTVKRTVKVIAKLNSTVKKETKDVGYYTGKDPNNYIYFSGMLFRIVGLEGKNVKIVSNEDIANINYSAIEEWLDNYYYEHLTKGAKNLIVKNKYCNMNITEDSMEMDECTSYTKKKKVYILSITDINKANDENKANYLKPQTISWTANQYDEQKAYTTRKIFYDSNSSYYTFDKTENYGVRPVLTINGNIEIKGGTGSYENPYKLGETPIGKPDDKINTRNSGEYIKYSGITWRIVEVNDDGTTKIISDETIKKQNDEVETYYNTTTEKKIYNPKETGNVGYFINNKVSEYVETSYFVNKEIKVPIYKDKILYGKETSTKKYKVKLSAPNMYEMFSAFSYESGKLESYWLINSSKQQYTKAAITEIGVPVTSIGDYTEQGVRVVGNLNKSVIIVKGKGTKESPYNITK